MISKTIGFRGLAHFQTHPYETSPNDPSQRGCRGPLFFPIFETNNAVKGPHSTTARASRAGRCVVQRAFAGSTHKEVVALLHKANKTIKKPIAMMNQNSLEIAASASQPNRKRLVSNATSCPSRELDSWCSNAHQGNDNHLLWRWVGTFKDHKAFLGGSTYVQGGYNEKVVPKNVVNVCKCYPQLQNEPVKTGKMMIFTIFWWHGVPYFGHWRIYGGLVNLQKLWSFSPLARGWTHGTWMLGLETTKKGSCWNTFLWLHAFLLPRFQGYTLSGAVTEKKCTCSTSYVLQGEKTPQLATELTIVNHFRWPFQIVKDSRTHLHHWWNPTAHFFWKDAQPLVIKGGREIPKKNLRWEKHQTKWLWK